MLSMEIVRGDGYVGLVTLGTSTNQPYVNRTILLIYNNSFNNKLKGARLHLVAGPAAACQDRTART